ncbi:ABC transporter ATP-binding protein [Clostridium algidicarnis]|uniref:Oligopeptide transport system ATP-binding protein n=2 Tax=Clostridium algidicarnis TaxID=37659 RepID=A0A2S6FXD1_9CLOT|nr:dipeptide ABC transporter ATP-binding protein [Clostridium algidicarnis]MBB6630228.1 dipeptide ABC transporter ATP-binding protein [Clostridium algidicarnis]MBB6698690.1 dipeptide ABC transporter ATP-binding protein [Clostridium algidicarnis]MBU3192953.1 dipeptide ABC transporter ATP-binding protein [Clostridium algidicarnis]MBU3203444.1 dipeptide ABC transporter ATP-binding protein [Clostridium algidicarnis]MBU3206232.1 dipeptide ABC transporter ATP-binding protein [Clostridium algidicarni
MSEKKEVLLEVNNLTKFFPVKKGSFLGSKSYVKAVDRVSFKINRGETLGLVGESGCGKTTLGRTAVRLYDTTAGEIIYKGVDLAKYSQKQMLPYRRKLQMIFQDPYASLDSRMTVGDIIGEAIDIHNLGKGKERLDKIRSLLDKVGLNGDHISRYPHEFSGGQRQRIGIARALAVEPEFIVCDEPISALDVSIQAQVVNMLEDLQKDLGLTYLFIAHDLSMVKHISNNIGVMYLGRLVEVGESNELYDHPLHPYTQALLSAIPIPDPKASAAQRRIVLKGEIPSPIDPPPGCRFKGRCKYAKPICSEEDPDLKEVQNNHFVACHLY